MRIQQFSPCAMHRGVFFLLVFGCMLACAGNVLHAQDALQFGNRPDAFDQPQAPTDEAVRLLDPLEVEYPDWAVRQRIEGVSIIAVWIDASGLPVYGALRESSGNAALDSIALRAVRRGTFKAARREGKNVASRLSIPVEFRLRRDEDHYDVVKDDEQLEQEADELRRARDMLHEEQQRLDAERRKLEDELQRLREEQKRAEEEEGSREKK